jgi:hypothetical protein
LLTQRNIEEAAKVVGIASNTLLSWMKVPEFQTAYRERDVQRSGKPSRASNKGPRRQPPLC